MSKKITIIINPQGEVHIALEGYQGKECDQETLLGLLATLLEEPETGKQPEYYHMQAARMVQGRG